MKNRILTCYRAALAVVLVTANTMALGQVVFRNLEAQEIVYDPVRHAIIASVPGQNRLIRLNPTTLGNLPSDFITTGNPTHLAISQSANMLYVGLDTAPEIIQIDLSTWTQVRRFGLGLLPNGVTPALSRDIAVKPDDDEFIVVPLRTFSSVQSLAAYLQGVRLPNQTGSAHEVSSIVFGSTSDTLYGSGSGSERGLRRFLIDAQGVTLTYSISSLLPSGTGTIVHADDLLYTDRNAAFHGPSATQVGTYNARGIPIPAPEIDRVFFFDFGERLMSFEMSSFSFVEETHDFNFQGSVKSAVRWGEDGFSVATIQGYVYSFRSSLAWDQVVVQPSTVNVIRGIVLGGNGASLNSPDNDRLHMRPGVTFTSAQAPIEIELQAVSPVSAPPSISLSVESQGTSTAVIERVSFYDYVAEAFVVVKERPTLSQDERIQCDAFDNGQRFVHPVTGEMRARLSYKANGPVFTFPWSVKIDLARWVVPK